ncbi:sphingosine kinase [Leifsonia sp. LS1]|uniref:diacylglycerol/lipid kinase family protein n=1 Tax=Leifsonia sp. LS1 TaxID=2828483 RepID=UPI001CFDFFE7|nr:diacylglycerol kinase family protein [Leifsonia sp. LS1]GIT78739.1 sphingosine kinase [Leifsonia sp. LS1]
MSRDLVEPRAAVVYNPSKVRLSALRTAVAAQEEQAGWAPSEWFATSADDDGRGAVENAMAADPQLVIVAGGDGTLRAAAAVLAGSGIGIGVVPSGTGNLFARELGLPVTNTGAAVATAFDGEDRLIDLGFAHLERAGGESEERAFLVMAGIGLDAHMAAHTNQKLKKRIGWLAYSDPIARSILGNRRFDMVYGLDDKPDVAMRAHTVIVGNSGSLTAGMLLIPDAVVDDGLLDAVVMRPKGGGGWADIGYRLAFNRLLHRTRFGRFVRRLTPKPRAILYAQATTLRVRFREPQEIQLDGDPNGSVIAAKLRVEHHALTVRVPRG